MSYYFNSIVDITLPITAFICLMLLLSPLFKRTLVIKWRYYVWLFISIRLLIPFKIKVLKPISIVLPQNIAKVDFTVYSKETVNANSLNLGNVLFYVWLSFAACFLIINIFSYVFTKRNIKKWKQKPSSKTISVAEKCEIRKDKIIICKKFLTPVVFGIIKPIIILPREDYTESELSMILMHESVHLKNMDVLYKIVLLLTLIVHWFNPAVWIMYKMGVRDLEVSCDKEVTKGKDSDFCAEYCHALISAVRKGKKQFIPCSTSFDNSKQIIKERVTSVFDRKRKRKGNLLLCCSFGFVVVCGGMIEYTSAKVIENTPAETVIREIKKTDKPQQELKTKNTVVPENTEKTKLQRTPKSTVKTPENSRKKQQETVLANNKTSYHEQTEDSKKTSIEVYHQELAQNPETEPEVAKTQTPDFESTENGELQNSETSENEQNAELPELQTEEKNTASVYSIEENSLNIPVSPDMNGQVVPLEFTGNAQSVLSVGCVDGDCGYNILNSDTGEICVDNSSGQNNKATVELDGESSYSIQVFSTSEENASIYVYKE